MRACCCQRNTKRASVDWLRPASGADQPSQPMTGRNSLGNPLAGQYGVAVTTEENQPGPGLAGAGAVQSLLLTVRFLSEVALVAVLVGAALASSLPLAGRIVIAVVAPVLAMAVWGRWMAPRARRRLPDPGRLIAGLVLCAPAAASLPAAGPVLAAVVFAVIAMGVAVLLRVVAPGG